MKHRIQITKPLRVKVQYAFDVDYDTETGESEVVSEGHAVSNPDTLRRREVMVRIALEEIDDDALIKLIDNGKIERPGLVDTVMHHGEPHVLCVPILELDEDDPEDLATLPGAVVVEALIPTDGRRMVSRPRRKRVRDNS